MAMKVIDETVLSQEERLEALLNRRLGNRIRNLRVRVHPQGVVLQGRAATYHAKQLAQHALAEMTDLPFASNDIEVC